MATVVSIISPGQSGSTILAYLLGAHPEIGTVGEVRIACDNARCSCGASYEECGFWKNVTAGMKRRGFAFDIRQSDLEFDLGGAGVSNLMLRTAVRGPLFEMARNVGIAMVPRAHRELERLLRRNEAFIDVVTDLKGCKTFLDVPSGRAGPCTFAAAASWTCELSI